MTLPLSPQNREQCQSNWEKSQTEVKTEQGHGNVIQMHKRLADTGKKILFFMSIDSTKSNVIKLQQVRFTLKQ